MINWNSIDKKDHIVLVTPRKKLFGENHERYFQGFSPLDFTKIIEQDSGFLTRGKVQSKDEHVNDGIFAESDTNYKQLLPYAVIVNKEKKTVYAYRRADNKNAHEKRLHGNWSWGVGGHVDFQDSFFSNDVGDFLKKGLMRELEEEVKLNNGKVKSVQLLGFINDDLDSVGNVHLGILFLVETDSTNIEPNDLESKEGRFMSINEIEAISNNLDIKCDNWSRIALNAIKKALS